MSNDPDVQLLLRLPLSLRRELKVRASELDANMNALLKDAIVKMRQQDKAGLGCPSAAAKQQQTN